MDVCEVFEEKVPHSPPPLTCTFYCTACERPSNDAAVSLSLSLNLSLSLPPPFTATLPSLRNSTVQMKRETVSVSKELALSF